MSSLHIRQNILYLADTTIYSSRYLKAQVFSKLGPNLQIYKTDVIYKIYNPYKVQKYLLNTIDIKYTKYKIIQKLYKIQEGH